MMERVESTGKGSVLPLLRNASKASYATGAYLVVSQILSLLIALVSIINILSSLTTGGSIPNVTSTTLATFAVSCATMVFAMIFGFYVYKVGDAYELSSLKAGGILYLVYSVVSVASALLNIWNPYVVGTLPTPTGLVITLLIGIASLGVGLAAYVCLIVGASNMKNKTGVESFGTAMILFILFFIPFIFAAAVLVFGSALSRLAEMGEKKRCPKCGKNVEAYAVYCGFCGERIK